MRTMHMPNPERQLSTQEPTSHRAQLLLTEQRHNLPPLLGCPPAPLFSILLLGRCRVVPIPT